MPPMRLTFRAWPTLRWAILGMASILALTWLRLQAHSSPAFIDGRVRGGALVAAGGGALPDEVFDRFFELAGGPRADIVVIPGFVVGPSTEARLTGPWKARGAASVTMFELDFRHQANDSEKLAPLDRATGVWFGGGSQTWLCRPLCQHAPGSPASQDPRPGRRHRRHSAGASVLSRVMVAGGREPAYEGRGFGLFPNAIIDQHFLRRNRLPRLRGLLTQHPDLLGFGVDEGTALVLERHSGRLSVVGRSYVVALTAPTRRTLNGSKSSNRETPPAFPTSANPPLPSHTPNSRPTSSAPEFVSGFRNTTVGPCDSPTPRAG